MQIRIYQIHFMQSTNSHVVRQLFYNAFIRSQLTYACQTWTLTCEQTRQLNSTHVYLLRRMIRGGFKRQTSESAEHIMPRVYNAEKVLKLSGSSFVCKKPYTTRNYTTRARTHETSLFSCIKRIIFGWKKTLKSVFSTKFLDLWASKNNVMTYLRFLINW